MKIKLSKIDKNNSIIFGLSASKFLAQEVSKKTGIKLGEVETDTFADNEMIVKIKTSFRGKKVFVIQSTSNPANDNLMELLIFLDAMKRSSAQEIVVIIPYFGYARQDRKNQGRQPITAKLVASLLETAGANRVVSFDIHSDQIQGFFDIPFDNLKAQGPIFSKVKDLVNKNDVVVVSPDHGGVSRARAFAKRFDAPLAIVDKRREKKNSPESLHLLGNVKGKEAIILDDIVDTASTMAGAIKFIKEQGAKKIICIATHGVFSNDKDNNSSLIKLKNAGVSKVVTTNSIVQKNYQDLIVVDLSEVIADVIKIYLNRTSISDYFIKKWS